MQNMAVLVVSGVSRCGIREILAVEPMYNESEETYTVLFNAFKDRGLEKVWLVISDAHLGLQAAVRKCLLGASWQRCKVHFMRNVMARVSHKDKGEFAAKLKQIWLQPDKKAAMKIARLFIAEYKERYPEAIEVLREGLEDSLQFYEFEDFDSRKIASTNILDRLHREIRRRSRVVGIFPSVDSYLRLLTSYLIEYSEDWSTSRCYIQPEKIELCESKLKEAA